MDTRYNVVIFKMILNFILESELQCNCVYLLVSTVYVYEYMYVTTLSKQWTSFYPVYDVYERCILVSRKKFCHSGYVVL
jgi:hypothetical protein